MLLWLGSQRLLVFVELDGPFGIFGLRPEGSGPDSPGVVFVLGGFNGGEHLHHSP